MPKDIKTLGFFNKTYPFRSCEPPQLIAAQFGEDSTFAFKNNIN